MKSEYRSGKSVAKNKTVPIAADDPRLAPDKIAQTRARQGAEIEVIGLDGKSLIAGGTGTTSPRGTSSSSSTESSKPNIVVPGINGATPYEVGYGAIVPTDITNVVTEWIGEDLKVTFDWDYADDANKSVSEFILEITSDGVTRQTPYGSFLVNRTQNGQTATLTKSLNRTTLGIFRTSITDVCVYAIDPFYNKSSSVCAATVDTYVLNLPVPVITVTPASNGYNVAYTLPTESVFDAIDIVEYESVATTEPTGVTYSRIYFDSISPASVLTVNTNSRWVKARFSSDGGTYTDFCAGQKVTPLAPVAVDTTGPANVTGVTATHGIDTSGYLGFNGYVDISWPAVTDSTLRGYRIRFTNDGGTTYTYANSPGSGTTYRLGGLAIGSTYKIAVATYDEFNNTSSSYVSLSPDIVINGTPSVSNYIEAGPFQFGVGVGYVSTNKGLYFDSSNYWYINSSDTARLKVGGDLNNYILWDGATFTIDGDITARGGYFAGNVSIISGGSLYSGVVSGGAIVGAGYILNSSGITFNSSSVNGITSINAANGHLTTASANIGGWLVSSSEISKTQTGQGKISLNSAAGYISISNDDIENQTAGINSPTLSTDDVFWSGSNGPDGTAPFRVNLEGGLTASNATIKGTIRAVQGGFGTFNSLNTITSGWTIDSNGMVAAGEGRIKLGNYSIKSNNGTDFQVYDDTASTFVIQTNTANLASSDQNRVLLGNFDRQVEVVKSAQISGDGTTSSSTANETAANAYRSGGLRNIYTISQGNFISHSTGNGTLDGVTRVNDYPSSIKGDVLFVYDSTSPANGNFRKVVGMYINTEGSNPVNSPIIATASTLTVGDNGTSVVVTSNNFATTVSTSNFTINAGTTGLTLSSITNTSTSSKTLVFTGTVASGTLQITALASAFNPVASTNSNTLNMVAGAMFYYAEAVTDGEAGTCPTYPHYISSTTITPSIIDARFTVNVSVGSTTHGYYSSISSSDSVSQLLAALPLCQSVPATTTTSAPATTTTSAPVVSVPVNASLPVITPSSGYEATQFSITNGTWSNSPTSYAYSWQYEESASPDGWAPIGGADSSTFTPGEDYVSNYGTKLACFVVASNVYGNSIPALSASVTVAMAAPTNTAAPHLTISGSTMTSTAGSWSNYPATYTYKWYRDDIGPTSNGNPLKTTSNTTSTTDTYSATNTNAYSVYTIVTAINSAGSTSAESDNSIEYYTAPATTTTSAPATTTTSAPTTTTASTTTTAGTTTTSAPSCSGQSATKLCTSANILAGCCLYPGDPDCGGTGSTSFNC